MEQRSAGNITTAPKYTEAQYKNGEVSEINWTGMAMSFQLMRPGADQVGTHINDLATTYAACREKIINSTSGDEQASGLKKLDDLILGEINRYADEFAGKAGDFLAEYGFSGEHGDLRTSVMQVFEKRVTEVQAFASGNPNYAGIRGTADAWMENDVEFMRGMLHYAMSAKQPEMNTAGGTYSVDDLQALGSMMKATGNLRHTYNESERNLFEAQFAVYAVKKETVFYSLDINSSLKGKLEKIFNNVINNTIDKANAVLADYRNEKHVQGEKEYRYRSYDKDAIFDMVSKIMDGLKSNRSVQDVLSGSDGLLQSLFQERNFDLHSLAQNLNSFARSLGTNFALNEGNQLNLYV